MAKPPPRRLRFSPTAPFTRAEARAAGISLAALRGPRFHKVFYDLYVCASVDVTAAVVRAAAALRVCNEGSYVSHFTAAEVWGACVPEQPLTHVSVRQGNRSERRGIQAHVAPRDANTTTYQGLLVATAEQTFLDLSGLMSLVELVVLGDSLIRKERTTPEELIRAAAAFRGRGARLARRAANLVRRGVDSPMESRLRLLIVIAGLPAPTVNFTIRAEDGTVLMRFDLSYPDLKLIIEYDGRQHARDDAQWGRDIHRREELDRLGWRLLIIRAEDIYGRPDQTLGRLQAALRARGAKDLPGKLRTEWRQHFPVRRAAA
jgi:very-short-patch-repair endonuclease